MTIRIVLAALAFDEDSNRTAERAVQLANAHGARIIGVHVIEDRYLDQPGMPPSVDAGMVSTLIMDEGTRRLRRLLASSTLPPLAKVEIGRPHAVVHALANSSSADLVVLGPSLSRSMRSRIFGTTADRIVRNASCPVLVVRRPASAEYKQIAIGMDFSDLAREAARFATKLAPAAAREFIHATEIPLVFEQAMLKAGTPRGEIDRYRKARSRAARQELLKMVDGDGRGPETLVKVVQGDPATALLNASRREGTDLVVVGTQGANAVAQHLLGSVARKVLAGCKCDVLVVPPTAM